MSRRGRDAGQSTVEFALVLPLLALLLLAVVQIGVIVVAQVRVEHAAREAARDAAVGDDATSAAQRVLGPNARVTTGGAGRVVDVVVEYSQPTTVPLVGALLGDVSIRASASMRREPES